MSKNKNELHEERLATTDSEGHRVYLYPENVKGKWRNLRTYFFWFLIIFYLVLPWIYFNGEQVLLFDLPARKFHFFGHIFYGHDAPILSLLLFAFIFLMGLITSLYGRAWCGWACPQTVFIDAIYSKIERIIEGGARQRKKLSLQKWDLEKFFKKGLKWILFLLVSLHISHSFLGYFVGTHKLLSISMSPPTEHLDLFITMLFLTGLFLFDFGWFREQFCIIACPYGRFQSVMMDEDSLVVAYKEQRGEPRRGTDPEKEGDCINCYHCVKVCPTGIDIRRGTQLECISCTNCIDACDEIMIKVGKPTGLVGYTTENKLKGKEPKKIRIRPLIYATAIVVVSVLFVTSLLNSFNLKATFVRASKTPFQQVTLSDQSEGVLNFYKLRIDYKDNDHRLAKIEFLNPVDNQKIEIKTSKNPIELKDTQKKTNIFFRFPTTILKNGNRKVTVLFRDTSDNTILLKKEINLVGPIK